MKTFYRIVFCMILVQTISLSNANAQVRSILPDNTFGTGGLVLNKINADFTAAPCGMDVQAADSINSNRSITTADSIVFNPDLTYGTVTDADSNVYKTITIGKQTWMAENLKTTKYRNGDSIPTVTDATAWSILKTGAQCSYNNDAAIGAKYGKLYNWYAVNDSRNIAPTGWHVPTDAEWTTLSNYVSANLGTSGSIAKALASKTDWASSTSAGVIGNDLTKNNTSGFTALPGGDRDFFNGTYSGVGDIGSWWSSTERGTSFAWYRDLGYGYDNVGRSYHGKSFGFSVRCVKDSVSTTEVKPLDRKAGCNLAIYPNPVNNELHISFEASKSGDIQAEIIDLQGNVLHRQILNSQNGTNHATISTAKFPSGLYLFRLQTGNTSETIKFYKH